MSHMTEGILYAVCAVLLPLCLMLPSNVRLVAYLHE